MTPAEALFWSGLSKLKPLLDDPSITEIEINGDESFVFTSGVGGRKKHLIEVSQESVKASILALAHVNEKDATKKKDAIVSQKIGNYRVTGVLSPVSYKGHVLRIRKHTQSNMTLDEMCEKGSFTEAQKKILIDIVEGAANYLVAGSTSSGKTTALNAMIAFIPKYESVICIENGIELQVTTENNTRLLEYPEYGIGCDVLLQTSLRLTPDRIIVGEIRRPIEAATFLDVMSAGHDGCCATIHANSARLTLMRFESLVAGQVNDSILSIRSRIASVLQYVVHFTKDKKTHRRYLSSIVEIKGIDSAGEYILDDLYLG